MSFTALKLFQGLKLESPESPLATVLFGHRSPLMAPLDDDQSTPVPERRPRQHAYSSSECCDDSIRLAKSAENTPLELLPSPSRHAAPLPPPPPPQTFYMKPSTSRGAASPALSPPCADNIPDRPSPICGVPPNPTRKSRSAADIFESCSTDHYDELSEHPIAANKRGKKSILVESNYDYTPRRCDELQLKRGSTIKVLRRGDDEDGWWYGETLDGQKGFFPQNHVQLAKRKPTEIHSDELQFLGLLGSGGFSVVKAAIYKGMDVAVKIPHSKFSQKEIIEAVREEAGIFQMLSHDNIVEMYGVVVGSEPGLVLELCHDSLANVCSSSKDISLSEEIIGDWGAQIARGMNYLHELNVLHRDLKAANILIKEKVCDCLLNVPSSSSDQMAHRLESLNGFCKKCGGAALNRLTLKIADLGLSKKLQVADCRMSVVGTVPYLAPEVIRDRKCSKAMDVWSFGLVLWEILTGTTPFKGLGPGAIQLQIGTFVKQQIPSSCPADLKNIINSCWRDDPHDRPTFKQLLIQLEKFADKYKTTDSSDRAFLENSLNTLRKSMMEEMTLIAHEMAKKAAELQKREENLKKGERELELNRMMFELQQTLSREPLKEKPQPPKRKQHLTCSDISKPFAAAQNGDENGSLSLVQPNGERRPSLVDTVVGGAGEIAFGSKSNFLQPAGSTNNNSNAYKNSYGSQTLIDQQQNNHLQQPIANNLSSSASSLFGLATLPRTPKKLSRIGHSKKNSDAMVGTPPVAVGSKPSWRQRSNVGEVPSTSTPDLLRLYWGSNASGSNAKDVPIPKDASPRLLHRVNARRVKKDSFSRHTQEDGSGSDERCHIVVSNAVADLENLVEQQGQRYQSSLDHLATPRRAPAPLPPDGGTARSRDHSRSSSATGEGSRTAGKGGKDEGAERGFFRKMPFFKSKDKSPAASGGSGGTCLYQLLGISMTPSRLLPKSAASTPKKSPPKGHPNEKKKSKGSTPDKSNDAFTLTENSKTFVKSGERRLSNTTNANLAAGGLLGRSPQSARSSTDDILSRCSGGGGGNAAGTSAMGRVGAYEKLSDASDTGILENPGYKPPRDFPIKDAVPRKDSTSNVNGYTSKTTSRSPSASPSLHQSSRRGTLVDDTVPCSSYGLIENLSYRPPSDMKAVKSNNAIVTLDSPVEGGVDPGPYHSMNSLDNSSEEGLGGVSYENIAGSGKLGVSTTFEDTGELYVPLSTIQRRVLNASPRVDNNNIPPPPPLSSSNSQPANELCSITNDAYFILGNNNVPQQQQVDQPSGGAYIPLSMQSAWIDQCENNTAGDSILSPCSAVSMLTAGGRPQRPFTLDLKNQPLTPAESGISTAGSSYRSLSSSDQAPQDHAPPPPSIQQQLQTITDFAPRVAPPIPPRLNARRQQQQQHLNDDDSSSRPRLSPVSQSP
ncbi:unnamed protein product [Anisakis simplex]|uniref:mitogen-activated protein kinase kinase kinase n=1 Tax=Anisakis simplex TaxID=6269 RepID=A0A158PN19_ANISI|nr:unnamed protein product [Anisakis simplex]